MLNEQAVDFAMVIACVAGVLAVLSIGWRYPPRSFPRKLWGRVAAVISVAPVLWAAGVLKFPQLAGVYLPSRAVVIVVLAMWIAAVPIGFRIDRKWASGPHA